MSTADVIPFPGAASRRLARALAGLDAARAEQAAAVAGLQQQLRALRDETERLRHSVLDWHGEVEVAQSRLVQAGTAVRALQATAARM